MSSADVTPRPETFPALNGLRFLAALAVVIFHYAPRVDGYTHTPVFVRNLINQGPCAVGFFFVLSGFVLAYRHLYGRAAQQRARDFYWARFVRLYPGYFLAFLLFLPVALQRYVFHAPVGFAARHAFVLSAALSTLMLQSWTPLAQAWNGPSWSLSVEAFMYFMFPLMAFRLIKLPRPRTIMMLLFCWLVPSSVAVAYTVHLISEHFWRAYITNNPMLWLPLFAAGICSASMISPWTHLTTKSARFFSTSAVLVLIVVVLAWPHQWADIFVTGGILPLLVTMIVCFTRQSTWLARLLASRPFPKLGDASYLIYILQAPLWHYWQPVTNYIRKAPVYTNVVPFWQFILFVPFLIFASLLTQRFVESPARTLLAAWKRRNFTFFGKAFRSSCEAAEMAAGAD